MPKIDLHISVLPKDDAWKIRVRATLDDPDPEAEPFIFDISGLPRGYDNIQLWLKDAARACQLMTDDSAWPDARLGSDFGKWLIEKLLGSKDEDPLRKRYRQSLDRIQRTAEALRIHLALPSEFDVLPWELLYCPIDKRFIATDTGRTLIRIPISTQNRSLPPRSIAESPLRIVAVIASPHLMDANDIRSHQEALNERFEPLRRSGNVEVEYLDKTQSSTFEQLEDRLAQPEPVHILHIFCHGGENEGEGVLLFADEHGGSLAISEQLRNIVRKRLIAFPGQLQLVTIAACKVAQTSGKNHIHSLPVGLVADGVPAVIAMQFNISVEAANTLLSQFYNRLLHWQPIDVALTAARSYLSEQAEDSLEWAIPALYMHAGAPDRLLAYTGRPMWYGEVNKCVFLQRHGIDLGHCEHLFSMDASVEEGLSEVVHSIQFTNAPGPRAKLVDQLKKPESSIVYAKPGYGKSKHCKALEWTLDTASFVVQFQSKDLVAAIRGKRKINEILPFIEDGGSDVRWQFVKFITLKTFAVLKKKLEVRKEKAEKIKNDPTARRTLHAMLDRFSIGMEYFQGSYWQPQRDDRAFIERLVKDYKEHQDEYSYAYWFNELSNVINPAYDNKPIYILVDYVNTQKHKDSLAIIAECMKQLIEAAMDVATANEYPRQVFFKFFLHTDLIPNLNDLPAIENGVIKTYRIEKWRLSDLREMIDQRIRAFRTEGPPEHEQPGYYMPEPENLDDFCEDYITDQVYAELARAAKYSPREFIRLVELIVKVHCASSFDPVADIRSMMIRYVLDHQAALLAENR